MILTNPIARVATMTQIPTILTSLTILIGYVCIKRKKVLSLLFPRFFFICLAPESGLSGFRSEGAPMTQPNHEALTKAASKPRGVCGNPNRWRTPEQAIARAAKKRGWLLRKRIRNLDAWKEWGSTIGTRRN